jgi:hypothetical protein
MLVIVLVIDGFLAYRFYDRMPGAPDSPGLVSPPEETLEPAGIEETTDGQTEETSFVQEAGARNVVDNSTYVDHPAANGEPGAVLLARPVGEHTHRIGVWYDRYRGGRWAIFNQDRSPMEPGAAFEVYVPEEPDAFVHRATPDNTISNATYADHALVNGKPGADLSVTQNWNPGGGSGTYNDHPVEAVYDAGRERWAIRNADGAPMPEGAAFNLAVSEPS